MYEKIAEVMNRDYGCSDMDAYMVERYLRYGETALISDEEADIMEELLDRFL